MISLKRQYSFDLLIAMASNLLAVASDLITMFQLCIIDPNLSLSFTSHVFLTGEFQ